jgi:hypothetical protein
MKQWRVPKNKRWWVILLLGVTLFGCKGPKPQDLPFETLERADSAGTGKYYEDEEPKLVIVTGAEEIDLLGNTISLDAQAQLRSLDFDRFFVIAVFQGRRSSLPTPRSGVEVQRCHRKGSTVTIYAQFHEPVEGHERHPEMNSPYHLVKIRKGEDMQGKFEFVLNVDGAVVSQQTHSLP